jgi:hypothetical protein
MVDPGMLRERFLRHSVMCSEPGPVGLFDHLWPVHTVL